jgi:hypothetical protein
MTPEERQLIAGLFDRMRQFGTPEKDHEADALIRQSVRQLPDAPYVLVQSVLVQEHALQQAEQRISELEEQVRDLESRIARQPAQTGSFLGGLFGGGTRPTSPTPPMMGRGSVPAAGSRMSTDEPPRSGPIGAPTPGPFGQPQQPAPGGGGSFMRSAMATAAGVAGGMLLANSISSMLGGSSAHAAGHPTAANPNEAPPSGAEEPHYQDAADNDPGTDDASLHDAGYETDAGDWGGGDLDI